MKRRSLAALLTIAMVLSLSPMALGAPATDAPTIYVSVSGDDTNDGSAGNPVATLQQAADLAKAKTDNGNTAVTVSVAEGKYFIASPLALDATHSNIHFVANGNVILTGAKALKNPQWTQENGLYVTETETGLSIDQLFINGE